jgi:uncharacterized protein with HEPN domain
MSRRDPLVRMQHMLDHAREAVALLGKRTEHDLRDDRVLQLALTRLIEIVGEAAARVPEVTRQQHPDLPWREAVGMRHVLAHGYDIVEYAIIWDTVRNSLPALIAQLESVSGLR